MTASSQDPKDLAARYSTQLLCADGWHGKADALLRAAKLLEGDIDSFWQAVDTGAPLDGHFGDVHAPYFMLVAFALENLCKAVLIQDQRDSLSRSQIRRLPTFLSRHDLRYLFAHIGLRTTLDEEDLLIRLTQCAVWLGRYPVPIYPDALRGSHKFSDGVRRFTACFFREDVGNLKVLVDKVRSRVNHPP